MCCFLLGWHERVFGGRMKDNDVRETPAALFAELNQEFRFTLDACATHQNARCPRYYTLDGRFSHGERTAFGGYTNGLTGSWGGERVWCNPPFSELQIWTDKAWEEQGDTITIVMLVPANRTDQLWWQKNVAPYVKKPGFDVRWLDHRTLFTVDGGRPILNKQGKIGSPSFSCALLIWS
jgi:phage N-6-adenine-methyltransferase